MQTHNLQQGSSLWHQFRADHFGASETAAMLGLSQYVTRNELLRYKATGESKEYSDYVQKYVLDYGNDVENSARLITESLLNDELFPATCSSGKLSASCDGLTIDGKTAWEHKQWNEGLANFIFDNNTLPDTHMPQCQQILLVTNAEELIFTVSDGTDNKRISCAVKPCHEWFDRIKSGWEQFEKDLEAYEPKLFEDKPEPAAIMQLPALSVYTKGDIAVHGNLDAFREASDNYIASINRDLKTDADFVNAEAEIKRCKEIEQTIKTAKKSIIGGISSVDEATRVLDYIDDSHAKIRLTLEKLVKSQKENIKKNIIDAAFMLCADHASNISREFLNINFFHLVTFLSRQNFETACKGLRTLASLHNAVDTEVAAIKIKLNDLAMIVRKNISHLPEDLSLFRDLQSIVTKPEEDFKLLVESRLADQKRKEEEAAKRAVAEATKISAQQEITSNPNPIQKNQEQQETHGHMILKKSANLIGFDKWWEDVGKNLTGDRMFLAKSSWESAKNEPAK